MGKGECEKGTVNMRQKNPWVLEIKPRDFSYLENNAYIPTRTATAIVASVMVIGSIIRPIAPVSTTVMMDVLIRSIMLIPMIGMRAIVMRAVAIPRISFGTLWHQSAKHEYSNEDSE